MAAAAAPSDERTLVLWVETTENCQLRCRYCYNFWRDEVRPRAELPGEAIDQLEAFLSTVPAEVRVSVVLAGGDPSAHSDFNGLIRRLGPQCRLEVVTHGANLTPGDVEALAAAADAQVQLSIPSPDPETYRFLQGSNSLERVIANAIRLGSAGVPLSISAVLTKRNVGQIEALAYLAVRLGSTRLILNRFLPSGRGAYYRALELDPGEFAEAVVRCQRFARPHGLGVLAAGPSRTVRAAKLAAPRITISVDGSLRLCSLVGDSFARLSDGYEAMIDSYRAFWRSPATLPGCYCSMSSVSAGRPVAA
jgi:MoaA/NifB/PqqE/SkfB family radical SAM enzyme